MVEIAHLKHCQKQSNLNNLDGKITSTVNLMPEIMSHCVPSSPHRAKTSPFNVLVFLLWPECPLTLSRWQLTASAASVCCSAFTTTLQSSVPASDWTAGLHPRFPLVHPSPSCGQCPLNSRPLMSVQTGDRASPEHNIAQSQLWTQLSGEWKCCKKSEL